MVEVGRMIEFSEINEKQTIAFWAKVQRGAPDECWNWTAARTKLGYGLYTIKRRPRYRSFKAHRMAYYLANGSIDDSLVVMHSCDNPSCCNPAHLSLGTMKENMADMWRKGRARPVGTAGERNGNSKLDENTVRMIRLSAESGYVLGQRFGVSNVLISQIKRGKIWKHVL
jgi:hypothetical protein